VCDPVTVASCKRSGVLNAMLASQLANSENWIARAGAAGVTASSDTQPPEALTHLSQRTHPLPNGGHRSHRASASMQKAAR
jgi:hypothetical protein